LFVATILFLEATAFLVQDKIPLQYKNPFLSKETVLIRLEFHRIAWPVFKDQPFFGLGFSTPLARHIPENYESKFYPADSKPSFSSMVTGVQTFDNMLLCFIGETGGLFTLACLGLVAILLKKSLPVQKLSPDTRNKTILMLIVLSGFLIHSMTFDSLKYPHLNWIFHSILGILACTKPINKLIFKAS